ncbi:lytic transglycosylase domain-containing protein [Microbacterium sp. bgisy203]|uniref:aggregation-promoting factor C-terminal-like domain-containing protein n=1 Tax=Microbacterium sp. bgisy203 TaxID=3413799 RepID=UPI003D727E7B
MPRLSLRFVTPALICAGLVATSIGATGAALPPNAPDAAGQSDSSRAHSVSAPLSTITARGESTLDKARAAVSAARDVTADIAASGLTLDVPSTVIDTSTLSEHIDKLGNIDVTPVMLVPSLSADTEAETQSVLVQTATLRGQLDAAVAKKAEEDAAAQAAAQAAAIEAVNAAAEAKAAAEKAAAEKAAAEQAAAEKAAAEKAARSSSGGSVSVPSVNVNVDPASAQGIARSMMAASYGWGDDQFACLVSLWNKESGWRVNAANPSGAYGIPQALPGSKMASAGADWATNPATQIAWGLGYISGRYGTPCGAWGHSQSNGWY